MSFVLVWLLHSLAVANAGFIGARAPAPAIPRQVGLSACATAIDFASFCESVSPGFSTLPPSAQAPCLCYSSTVWEPNVFDGAVLTCAEYASTADPADYSIFAGLEGFCSSVGDVLNKPASAPATTTTEGGNLGSNPGCSLVLDALSFCLSVTPGFTTLASSLQAPCLCYSSTVWEPAVFDNAVATCAEYASTAVPSDYSILTPLEHFCTDVGNVLKKPASVPATTTSEPPSQSTALGGNLDSNPDCSFVEYALSFCLSVTPGFTTLAPSLQAPCLCYSSSVWEPTVFDNAVATCAEFASTAVPSDYSILTPLEHFCADVGNVLTQPASTPVTTTPVTTTPATTTSRPKVMATKSVNVSPSPPPSSKAPTTIVFNGGTDSLIRRDGVMMKWFWSILSVVSSVLFHL